MRAVWIAAALGILSPLAIAQTQIWKHVDESGRVTYSNRPIKGAVLMELDPISTIPPLAPRATPGAPASTLSASAVLDKPAAKAPSVATVTPRTLPLPSTANATVASIDPNTQRGRDDTRRRILEEELRQEERTLMEARDRLRDEQQNPTLIAAVRVAQQAQEPTPAQQAEMRAAIERASGRIRGLQASVSEHEKNVEALRKELGALKP
ncbi:MAG: DUF4124 domain-containing protein [Betaproteobacteria bacterium]|nr:DUF4124 domain-containing protein [Betaproteobacteria bacterium]